MWNDSLVNSVDSSPLKYQIAGLTNIASYPVKVKAENSIGVSSFSGPSQGIPYGDISFANRSVTGKTANSVLNPNGRAISNVVSIWQWPFKCWR